MIEATCDEQSEKEAAAGLQREPGTTRPLCELLTRELSSGGPR